MFKKFSKKFGFTNNEIKVIVFLTATLLIGVAFNSYIKINSVNKNFKTFNYAKEDSSFLADQSQMVEDENENAHNERDEVLNIDKKDSVKTFQKKELAALSSVDINKADIKTLMTLPGIGEKTAKLIIDFRGSKGRLNSIQDLLTVKGIGAKKLEKIKPYIYIK